MVINLERRVKKLESVLPNREFLSLVLWFLRERGYEELVKIAQGGIPRFLLLTLDDTDILDLEEFRGLVPDEDIRAAYSFCRNYGQGNVMPGYVLLDNGCIVGAQQ